MTTLMRISLVLAREDNPRLFDELIQFPKGQRRVNRLRTLAYDGLLAQQPALVPRMSALGGGVGWVQDDGAQPERFHASLELFSDPLAE